MRLCQVRAEREGVEVSIGPVGPDVATAKGEPSAPSMKVSIGPVGPDVATAGASRGMAQAGFNRSRRTGRCDRKIAADLVVRYSNLPQR